MSLSDAIRAAAKTDPDPAPSPVERERVLRITFDSPTGPLSAVVTAKILGAEQRLARDRACAALASPARFDDLPELARARIWMLATVSQALIDPPQWLDQWCGEHDGLLAHIFAEVSAHERAFFRLDVGEGESEARGSGVVVDPVDSPRSPLGG